MSRVEPKPYLKNIQPYVAGEASVPGFDKPAKLSSNESPLGPSLKAIEAYRDAARSLARYPDGASVALREALAELHGGSADQYVCGTGSEQVLDAVARAYAGIGDEVLFTEHAFATYRIVSTAVGATPVSVPETDFTTDIDALLDAVTDRTRILFLANPNNPTGTFVPTEEIHRLHRGLRDDVLLVLDGAYAEYIDRPDYSAGHELVAAGADNVVVTGSFSKAYGLAALRVGYAHCAASVATMLHRVRNVFNVVTPAHACALAALHDRQHLALAKAHNDRWLPWLAVEIRALGLVVSPSIANFVLIHFADADQSRAADAHLRANGVILRPVANYGLGQCLRASVGVERENRELVRLLGEFLD